MALRVRSAVNVLLREYAPLSTITLAGDLKTGVHIHALNVHICAHSEWVELNLFAAPNQRPDHELPHRRLFCWRLAGFLKSVGGWQVSWVLLEVASIVGGCRDPQISVGGWQVLARSVGGCRVAVGSCRVNISLSLCFPIF